MEVIYSSDLLSFALMLFYISKFPGVMLSYVAQWI